MGTEFTGLSWAGRALDVFQEEISVTNQNISNAATTGYSRQRLNIVSAGPDTGGYDYYSDVPEVGAGVQSKSVEQIRDKFLDERYRNENSTKGLYDELSDSFSQLESVVSETDSTDNSDVLTGLSGQISTLVDDFKKLQASPDDTNIASTVKSQMEVVCQTVQSDSSQLDKLSEQIKENLKITVNGGLGDGGINATLKSIGELNKQIAGYEQSGQSANDLRDQRNNLLDQLSADMDIKVTEQSNGMVTVGINGDSHMLIDSGNHVNSLQMNADNTKVLWSDGTEADLKSGSVGADLQMINGDGTNQGSYGDVGIPCVKNMLDDFATGFTAAINKLATGDGGKALLTATSSSDMSISDDWKNSDSLILDNYSGSDKGNYIGQFITLFSQKGVISQNGSATAGTIQDFTDSISMTVSQRYNYIKQMDDSSKSIVKSIQTSRSSVSGVNLDEEGVNLIKYQQSYNATSRVITVINDMLDTLINKTAV